MNVNWDSFHSFYTKSAVGAQHVAPGDEAAVALTLSSYLFQPPIIFGLNHGRPGAKREISELFQLYYAKSGLQRETGNAGRMTGFNTPSPDRIGAIAAAAPGRCNKAWPRRG